MAAEWFCQIAGAEMGPLSSQQIKTMVAKGRLLPDDVLRRGTSGPWVPAARVKGLFPEGHSSAAAASPQQPTAHKPGIQKPGEARSGGPLPVARQTPGTKPAANTSGVPRTAKPIQVRPGQAAPPAAPADQFPEELAGGIPMHNKGMNFEGLGVDTSKPLKIAGRKAARANKEEQKKLLLIMGCVMGGALLLSLLFVTIHILSSGGTPAPAAAAPAAVKPPESTPATAKSAAKGDTTTAEADAEKGGKTTKAADKEASDDDGKKAAKSPAKPTAKSKPSADAAPAAAKQAPAKPAAEEFPDLPALDKQPNP